MRIFSRLAAVTAGFALAVTAVLAGAPAAFAHDSLVDADPAEGETITAVSEVSLRFSGVLLGVDTGANVAVVTGPDGAFYDTGCAVVQDTTLTLPVALGAAGTYQVEWRVVSSDGHPVSGEYRFRYEPPEDAVAATGAATSPCTGVAAATEPATDQPAAEGLWWGVGIGVGAVLLVVVAVLLILRPRRRSPTGN